MRPNILRFSRLMGWTATVFLSAWSFGTFAFVLPSDVEYWNQPQVVRNTNPSSGSIAKGTDVEVFHRLNNGRGSEELYVRISSGPNVGRYVWVHSDLLGPSQSTPRVSNNPNPDRPSPRTAKAVVTPTSFRAEPETCDPESPRSNTAQVQQAAYHMDDILKYSNEGQRRLDPQVGPLSLVRWGPKSPTSEWTQVVADALDANGKRLLESEPGDILSYCPSYHSMNLEQRKSVYAQMISAVAEQESTYRPWVDNSEDFNDKYGNPVISSGLLQLSLGDAEEYGCPFETEADLHNPRLNLQCGVLILTKRVLKAGYIGPEDGGSRRGASRYWNVLNSRRKRNKIKARVRQICQPALTA